ncbi:MAG: alginate lyase family protein [Bacteroidetes bacterium]|nr:alginate lyase family protein [Bacteroidota bacterium]
MFRSIITSVIASVITIVTAAIVSTTPSAARQTADSAPAAVHAVDSAGWLTRFIDRLDPASTPAELVRALGPDATEDRIIAAVAGYFRTRPIPDQLWVIPRPDTVNASYADTRADKALSHLITTRAGEEQYGDTLPWFSATKKLTTISRFPHLDYLALSYFHTGDERYAKAMIRDMVDFVEHVPIEPPAGIHVQVDLRVNPWNWVLLQWRAKRWMDALVYLQESPSLSDEQYLRLTLHIWEEIDWLIPHKVLGLHNGTLGNLSAIVYAAVRYPEASRAHFWLRDAGSFFNAFVDLAFYPGEFLVELTVGYSEGTLLMCLDMLDGLPRDSDEGLQLRNAVAPKLERIVDAHVGIMKPDRSLPRYGDHGSFDIRDRILRRAARLFNRPDLRQLADDPNDALAIRDKQSFPYASDPYYLSGYYAMRDGWDEHANYLSMDAGPFGTNHHHGDKLSITVSGDGASFIVDPGTSLYSSNEAGPRIDLRPGFLHNNVTVDNVDVNTGWDRHYGFDVLDNRWVTNSTYDFLEGVYEYRNNLLDVVWRRSVFFRKGEYWLVIDALLGDGEHSVESNFQTGIDTRVQLGTNRVTAVATNGAQLSMDTAPDSGLVPKIVVGDTTARPTTFLLQYPTFVDWTPGGRGWVGMFGNASPRDFTRTYPAPAILFSGKITLPHTTVRALSPSHAREPVRRTLTWLEKTPEHWRLEIREDGTDVVDVLDWTQSQRVSPRLPLADDSAFWYRTVAGEVQQIVLMNTEQATVRSLRGTIHLAFDGPFEGYATRTEDGWRIYADEYLPSDVQLTSFFLSVGRLAAPIRFTVSGDNGGVLRPGAEYLLTEEK